MRVLLTGAGGQVAHALTSTVPPGVELRAADRTALDVADAASLDAALDRWRPDVLVNAAAYTRVDAAEREPDAALRANRDGPRLLALAAAHRGIRLVHFSTDYVFDGRQSRPYRPDDAPAPLNVYGTSKAAGEAEVRRHAPDALLVRIGWVYSRGRPSFLERMLAALARGGEVKVVADQIGTPTHARSLARAVWQLIDAGATGVHHYADAGVASWFDFAVAIGEEAAAAGWLDRPAAVVPIAANDYPTAARRPRFSVLDTRGTAAWLGGAGPHWRTELRRALGRRGDGA
jgi:dTDP-4-dehydrorhamnose reductase